MALTKKQEDLYRQTMEEAKSQLDTIDDEMEKEIQKARERLAKLQESKESFRQLYEGAARLLGIKVETEKDSEQKKEPSEDKSEENSSDKSDL
jgi:hypothetical protein